MDMRKYRGSHFLKVEDVRDGPIRETIAGDRMGKYDKPDLIFVSGNILSLNVTNTAILCRAFGDESSGWIDKDVELFLGEGEYQGKMQEMVQVRPLSPTISTADRAQITKKLEAAERALSPDEDVPF
jgi:hypothetical protein